MEDVKQDQVSSASYEVGAKSDVKPAVKVYAQDVAVAEEQAAATLKRMLGRIKAGEFA